MALQPEIRLQAPTADQLHVLNELERLFGELEEYRQLPFPARSIAS
jgi:hypothetical protein